MAEYVKLPIFDADGIHTGKHLEVDTRHFLGAASNELAHNYIKVVQKPTPEEEKEMIDRIIAGLPARPLLDKTEVRSAILQKHDIRDVMLVAEEDGIGMIELVDFSSKYPKSVWYQIPRYTDWEYDPVTEVVRNRETKEHAPVRGENSQVPYVNVTHGKRPANVALSWIVSQIKK